jgi:pyridoxamine 5'-phosphate oxidase
MRAEYAETGLDEATAGDDPLVLFDRWLEEAVAANITEPNAMALATASLTGRPSVRIVLLKGIEERAMTFYTNYSSRKGRELEENPFASAVLLWHPLQRQVRVEGQVERVPVEQSDAYFASRPRGSQLGAVSSPQSDAVSGRFELEARFDMAAAHFAGREVERPGHWGGYRLVLQSVEFWQGRVNRMHDRLRFDHTGDDWSRERLAP